MATWIFQANPDHYDIDGYLASGFEEIVFTVTRYSKLMQPGDQVFLWRAQGKTMAKPGIVAEGTLLETPKTQADDLSGTPFWVDPSRSSVVDERVRLRINRVANKKELIRKEWLLEDPIANEISILKMANATNYQISDAVSARLNRLWNVTGVDWDRADNVAGLWAFKETLGGSISKLPNSPVSQVSLRIGRAVTGVYNKVLNFRSLDPEDPRKGFSGGGELAKEIWAEFYDKESRSLMVAEIDAEYQRLWGDQQGSTVLEPAGPKSVKQIKQVENLASLSREELEERLQRRTKPRNDVKGRPKSKLASTKVFDRDPLIVALRRVRANHKCELADCKHPRFLDSNGLPYCEIHHILPLAEGGADILENLACLCPAHHVESHRGQNKEDLKAELQALRLRIP